MTAFHGFLIVACSILACVISAIYRPMLSPHYAINSRQLPILCATLIILGSIGLYGYLGKWSYINELTALHDEQQDLRFQLPKLEQKANANPKDLAAQIAYARALGTAGMHTQAANYFKVAVILSNGRPDLILDYATAQILSADGMVSEEAMRSVNVVLTLIPDEPQALFYKAVNLQQNSKNTEAKTLFTQILKTLPANDPLRDSIQKRLALPNNPTQ